MDNMRCNFYSMFDFSLLSSNTEYVSQNHEVLWWIHHYIKKNIKYLPLFPYIYSTSSTSSNHHGLVEKGTQSHLPPSMTHALGPTVADKSNNRNKAVYWRNENPFSQLIRTKWWSNSYNHWKRKDIIHIKRWIFCRTLICL